ncbi:MAG: hypothetical protein HYV65_01745 [Candidatus Spechtbacteria bacterium]|nr:hypothetical protein [Candidatus Spechtbacteria bacterium]
MKRFLLVLPVLILLYVLSLVLTQLLWPITLVSSFPETKNVSTSPDIEIIMTFSSSLPNNIIGQIQSNYPDMLKFARISTSGPNITITPVPNLSLNTDFSISLNTRGFNPLNRAVRGNLQFRTSDQTPIVVRGFSNTKQSYEYNKLGYSQLIDFQKRLEEANPLLRLLPHESDGFHVDYGVSDEANLKAHYLISVNIPSDSADRLKTRQEIFDELQGQEGLALDWIRSKGFDPATLDIRMPILDINQIQVP